MKATLYEVLGVSPTASQIEIKTALRSLVRKYYQESSAEGRDAEEILRFLNHAASTLADPQKRANYDAELSRAALAPDTEYPEGESPFTESPFVESSARATRHTAKSLASKFTSVGSARTRQAIFIGFALVTIAALSFSAQPSGSGWEHLKFLLTWLTIGLVVIGIVYGVVWIGTKFFKKSDHAAVVPEDMLTLGGNTSVFLGGPGSTKKDTGAFRFQVGKKAPSKETQRSSVENPALRFAARMIDYGITGLLCGYLLTLSAQAGWIQQSTRDLLLHPFVAPLLIVFLWVPVEIACLFFLRTTPGKWLTNTQIGFNVSDPFAPETPAYRLAAISRRTLMVWARGMGFGLPLVTLITQTLSRQYLKTHHETAWDLDGDCLVTHGKIGFVNGTAILTVLFLLVSIYGHAWEAPMHETLAWAKEKTFTLTVPGSAAEKSPAVPVAETDAPVKPRGTGGKSSALGEQAQQLSRDQNWDGLIAHCQRWSNQDPKNAEAWHCLGNGYYKARQYKNAIKALQKAGKLAPTDSTIKSDLGNSFRAQYQQ